MGAVCLPAKIIPTESSLSFRARLFLRSLAHFGVHCTLSAIKSTTSESPRKVTVRICVSSSTTSLEHSQVPLNSRAIKTGTSACKIDGTVLGLELG